MKRGRRHDGVPRRLRRARKPRLQAGEVQPPEPDSYERERAKEVTYAISSLWAATDYPESREISNYSEDEMKAFLGQWIFIKKACDEIFDAIRAAHPDLPGWAPIQGEKPIE